VDRQAWLPERRRTVEEAGDGCHYHPPREQVAGRLGEAGLVVVASEDSPGDGHSYLHLLAGVG
jgi:hypothetical protein